MDLSQHQTFIDARPAAARMPAEDYLRLLHPLGAHGSATLMRIEGDKRCARTFRPDALPVAAAVWLDTSSYVTLHRFHGPRSGGRLAALNVLALDLDYRDVPRWHGRAPEQVAQAVQTAAQGLGLPLPSVITDTGRGLALLWLLHALPAAAEPRWRAAQRCLIGLFMAFGADRSCCDAARIFRIPETVNTKCGRTVTVVDGTLQRHDFDPLADMIHTAAGQPTRAEMARRKARKLERQAKPAGGPRGLAPAPRFAQVRGDLMALARHWGAQVPEGLRNTWLHLVATCLTHQHGNLDLEAEVEAAARYCAGLPSAEVSTLIRAAERRHKGEQERYYYSGGRIAEMLGVSDDLARRLHLKQIHSEAERGRRRLERESSRRRAKGMVPREEYLATHRVSRDKPWEAHGISRATWYRRGRPPAPASNTAERARPVPLNWRETPPPPPQGGLPRRRPRPNLSARHQPLHLSPEGPAKRNQRFARPTPTRPDPGRRPPEKLPNIVSDLSPTPAENALAEEIFPGAIPSPIPLAAARAS
ncbi:hypothetical protein [Alloyangia pacifica]|uniref:Uncharacterized protein n=1 Tax=Alloyangia pacifica TaxID=311180 RepID=A0A1I6RJZ1_9RHOB|nr:hypothetical protein [Alloyangia pacifica]SDG52382.1 hypothetical protein SAMN04488245_103139 [Alloyangia pacifica]SFS64910.1 hypothetical protein SAMN04488050_103139 [Alloyangia pacifica]